MMKFISQTSKNVIFMIFIVREMSSPFIGLRAPSVCPSSLQLASKIFLRFFRPPIFSKYICIPKLAGIRTRCWELFRSSIERMLWKSHANRQHLRLVFEVLHPTWFSLQFFDWSDSGGACTRRALPDHPFTWAGGAPPHFFLASGFPMSLLLTGYRLCLLLAFFCSSCWVIFEVTLDSFLKYV